MFVHQFPDNQFVAGSGVAAELDHHLERNDVERVMLICGENVGSNDVLMNAIRDAVGDYLVSTYTGARSDQPLETVRAGISAKRDAGADCLLALGGGSASDTAKAINTLDAESDRSIHELKTRTTDDGERVVPDVSMETDPLFAVATTLSAAEVSCVFAVTDESRGEKALVIGDNVRPDAIFYDPELTATTPKDLLARSAMNAFGRAIEIRYSSSHDQNAFFHATSEKAIELLIKNLPEAKDGDAAALRRAHLGAALSAFGLTDGIGLNMAINHALCARHPVFHGDGNSALILPCLRYNFEAAPEAIRAIGGALGVSSTRSDSELLTSISDRVRTFQNEISVPGRLREVDVDRADFDNIARIAVNDAGIANNPRSVTVDDITEILQDAW